MLSNNTNNINDIQQDLLNHSNKSDTIAIFKYPKIPCYLVTAQPKCNCVDF